MEQREGKQFKAVDVGTFEDLHQYSYTLPALSITVDGKLFLSELLGLTGTEISLNKMPPEGSMPFCHRHRTHEEVYIFLAGEGEFQVDGEIFPVGEGTVVRVDPEGERTWRNTSGSQDLMYIVIQAPAEKIEATTTGDGIPSRQQASWRDE